MLPSSDMGLMGLPERSNNSKIYRSGDCKYENPIYSYKLHPIVITGPSAVKGPPLLFMGFLSLSIFDIISQRRKDGSCIKCIWTKST